MIISQALSEVFKGITLQVDGVIRTVQYHYGDQKELNKWVKVRGNLAKYPLIWYVRSSYTEIDGKFFVEKGRIVLLQNTKESEMNDWRSANTYKNVLQPLSKIVQQKLLSNPYVSVYGSLNSKFTQFDEPKYGLPSGNDEKGGSNQSITTDIVDAKIINFKFEIQPNCLIK